MQADQSIVCEILVHIAYVQRGQTFLKLNVRNCGDVYAKENSTDPDETSGSVQFAMLITFFVTVDNI